MTSLTVNEQVASDLASLTESTEIRDDKRRLIGVFRPATDFEKRFDKIGVHSTAEVLAHLRTLTNDPILLADLDRNIEEIKGRESPSCVAQ